MKQALYVAYSACGIVKVGRSMRLRARSIELRLSFARKYGATMIDVINCGELSFLAADAERELITRLIICPGCRRLSNEWFFGISPWASKAEADDVHGAFLDREQSLVERDSGLLETLRSRRLLREEAFA